MKEPKLIFCFIQLLKGNYFQNKCLYFSKDKIVLNRVILNL